MVYCPCRRRARARYRRHLRDRERGFILDSVAVNNISTDHAYASPKVGSVIPPYNAQRDPQCWRFFQSPFVQSVLRKTGQAHGGSAIDGVTVENFDRYGPGRRYLDERNEFGGGHSPATYGGHSLLLHGVKPVLGFNGPWGYRRNTPNLRLFPSQFEPPTKFFY